MQQPATAYLGMDIRRGHDMTEIYISQPKLSSDIVESYLSISDKSSNTPSRVDMLDFSESDNETDHLVKQLDYLS